jgi:rhodanese-related sulfurtransferase
LFKKLENELAQFPHIGQGGEMEATRVTVEEVKQRMDRGEAFTFVDTRNSKAWSEGQTKLPGAIRLPADEVEKHLNKIPRDRTVITYCT